MTMRRDDDFEYDYDNRRRSDISIDPDIKKEKEKLVYRYARGYISYDKYMHLLSGFEYQHLTPDERKEINSWKASKQTQGGSKEKYNGGCLSFLFIIITITATICVVCYN
jgi:hypothetical protein